MMSSNSVSGRGKSYHQTRESHRSVFRLAIQKPHYSVSARFQSVTVEPIKTPRHAVRDQASGDGHGQAAFTLLADLEHELWLPGYPVWLDPPDEQHECDL